jgi:hypothetical protein
LQALNRMHSLAAVAQHVPCLQRRFSTGTCWELLITNSSMLRSMDLPSRLSPTNCLNIRQQGLKAMTGCNDANPGSAVATPGGGET